MIPTLITFLTRLFALIGGLARFLRVPRTLHTPAAASPPTPVARPAALSDIEAQLDAQIAEFDQLEREYHREQRAYRKRLREQAHDRARARGELPPPKPRKPRESKPKAPPITLPQASPKTPPAVTAAPNPNPLPQTPFKALPAVQPASPPAISSLSTTSRPTPPKATPTQATTSQPTPSRTLFKTLSTILIAPLRILKNALLALPRLFFRRRPPSSGPPTARPSAPSLQNRAA